MNLPTWITVSRLLGVPLLLVLLTAPTQVDRWIATGVFLLAAGTDWLDGYLARRLNQVTELGKFLDPLVDKLLVLAPLLLLVELNQVPAWGVFLIVAREITIAGWRVNPAMQGARCPVPTCGARPKPWCKLPRSHSSSCPTPKASTSRPRLSSGWRWRLPCGRGGYTCGPSCSVSPNLLSHSFSHSFRGLKTPVSLRVTSKS